MPQHCNTTGSSRVSQILLKISSVVRAGLTYVRTIDASSQLCHIHMHSSSPSQKRWVEQIITESHRVPRTILHNSVTHHFSDTIYPTYVMMMSTKWYWHTTTPRQRFDLPGVLNDSVNLHQISDLPYILIILISVSFPLTLLTNPQ